jgi:F0F1-type ATP synthase alpha subunit
VVDVLFPVANGQRELVIGDRQSGKSTVWLCSSISSVVRNSSVISARKLFSIISFVGSRCSTAIRFLRMIERCNSRSHSIFLIAPVTDAMGAQYTAHLTATAISEIYRNTGSLFQAAYDDLSKHAVAYRQLCLFLRKPAGREAYPSDVFYLHARLLERSCNLGGAGFFGALMSLPVIETLNNDLSAYIATNVISITDGQLYLDLTLFGLGQCPAISTEKSVSRVGAKSLDELSRNSAFALYAITGAVKQEADNANKSEGFLLRFSRYKKFTTWLVQRSSQAKAISTAGNFSIHSGLLDVLPASCLPIFLLFVADYAFANLGLEKVLQDRLFARENQLLVEITGHQSKYLHSYVAGLRLAVAVSFFLASILHTVASSAPALAANILLTLGAATSFLVDIRDASHAESGKPVEEEPEASAHYRAAGQALA